MKFYEYINLYDLVAGGRVVVVQLLRFDMKCTKAASCCLTVTHHHDASVRKASLLAGVGFALAMNCGQTVCSLYDLHVELVLAPLLDMMNHL